MTTTKLIKRTGFQLTEAEALGATTTSTTAEWDLSPAEVLARIDSHLASGLPKGRNTATHSLRRAVVALLEQAAPKGPSDEVVAGALAALKAEMESPEFAAALDSLDSLDDLIDETVVDEMGETVTRTQALENETLDRSPEHGLGRQTSYGFVSAPEPVYISSVDFSGLRWLVPGADVPENAQVVDPAKVDPAVRDEARSWLASYVPEVEAPAVPLAGIEIGRPKIVEAVREALTRMPKGSKSKVAKDGSLVVADGEAAAVVSALTAHMRDGIKADRGGFMYTARQLRRTVRPAIIAAFPEGAEGLPQPKAKAAGRAEARVEALNDQLAAARTAKAAATKAPAKRAG